MKTLLKFAALFFVMMAGSAHAQSPRSVILVLDGSGSMNAELPDGTTRIEAAKAAITELVGSMDAGTRIALRAYGHQSPRSAKDCEDTALLTGFANVADNGSEVISMANGVTALGYTPITLSITEAANDIANEEAGERIVILVSDGEENCAADPCIAAQALADADAKLAIHTIGFGVGPAARSQLQCISNMARGTYFDATNAGDLSEVLRQAAVAEATVTTSTTIKTDDDPGGIRIDNTWPGWSHLVTEAEDSTEVVDLNGADAEAELPPGIYNVQFANGIWRGVEINPGETTVLTVGILQIEEGANDLLGYALLDPETGETVVEQTVISSIPLLPTVVSVTSGHLLWPNIEIKAGETTVLRPGRITVTGENAGEYRVTTQDGQEAGSASRLLNLPLPPGDYIAEVEGQQLAIHLEEGQTHEIRVE